jgi:cytochrome d ubiquinol oxidase subunit I
MRPRSREGEQERPAGSTRDAMDVILLARAQFALTAMFHFIFPTVSIGLAGVVAVAEVIRWRTGSEAWDRLAVF